MMLLFICLLVWWHKRTIRLCDYPSQITTSENIASSTGQMIQTVVNNQVLDQLSILLSTWQMDPDPEKRNKDMQAWADGISVSDILPALQFLQGQEQTDLTRALQIRLIRRWAQADVATAAAWVEGIPSGAVQQEALQNVAIIWANQNLTMATQWVLDLPDASEREDTIGVMAYEAARSSPLAALVLATNLPTGSQRDDIVRYATTQWAAQDPNAAAQWVGQMDASPLKDQMLADVATQMAESDPVAAAALAVQSVPTGKLQDDAVVGIVERWTQQNPTQAANWVAQFPSGNLQQDALANLISLWTAQNWQAPAQWLEKLPNGSLRDTAVEDFAVRAAIFDKSTALVWAGEISDPNLRSQVINQLGQNQLGPSY